MNKALQNRLKLYHHWRERFERTGRASSYATMLYHFKRIQAMLKQGALNELDPCA